MSDRAFTDAIHRHRYFSNWMHERDGFWLYAGESCAGIELRHGGVGVWKGAGVERWLVVTAEADVAGRKQTGRRAGVERWLEVTAGHSIATETVGARSPDNLLGKPLYVWDTRPVVSLKDGFYCVSRRCPLTSVLAAEEVNMLKVLRIVDRDVIPWFESMKQIDAFENWVADHALPYEVFPLTLELHGHTRVRDDVGRWVATLPRDIDDVIKWLSAHGILDTTFCERLRRASWQEENVYRERAAELRNELSSVSAQSPDNNCVNGSGESGEL